MREIPHSPVALYKAANLFGTLIAETILASVHVRARKQAGHMDASDLINAAAKHLARRRPSTYGECDCRADFGDVDAAVGPRFLPADAVRPGKAGADPDGVGRRGNGLDWTMGCRPAGQRVGDAAPAGVRSRADRARRVVAGPVAWALAGLGPRRDRGWPRDDAADPPARYCAGRFRPAAGGARG